MVHGKAAELPFSVLDDAIGSFSAEGDRIKVVLRASGWTRQEGILGETMAKLPLVSQGERWDLGLEDGGRDRERQLTLRDEG